MLGGDLLLAGCQTTAPKPDNTAGTQTTANNRKVEDYFPLEVGARWRYKYYSHITRRKLEFNRSIVRKKGRVYYDNLKARYNYDINGVREGLRYLLKYPLEVGNRWVSVVGVTQIERYQIIDLNRTVRVPAGTFRNCIVVRTRQKVGGKSVQEVHFTFAPDVGFVKIRMVVRHDGKRIPQWTQELLSYQPSKKSAPSARPAPRSATSSTTPPKAKTKAANAKK